MSTYDKIMEATNRGIQEKLDAAAKEAQAQADRDREKIEKALEMIQQNLVYKDTAQQGWGHHYVLATEEMFFADYVKDTDRLYSRGLKFSEETDGSNKYIWNGVFTVNGERYYDMRYVLQKYGHDVEATAKKIERYRDQLREIQKEYENAVNHWPQVKQLIQDWNSLRESRGEDESQ